MRVLRITHSAVVGSWRGRERSLAGRGVDVTLLTAASWHEGGAELRFQADGDSFARPVRTVGRHPNLFVFDPRPLWRALAEQPYDVLDVHEEPCSLATAEVLVLRALRGARVPFVLYSAQNIEKRYPVPFRWIERWSLRSAGGVSVCNEAAGRIVTKKGLGPPPSLIPLGVDVERFAPATRVAPARPFRVGYVGRLDDHKGVAVLVEAVAGEPSLVLEVVGAGPQSGQLASLADRLGVADRVAFVGPVGHEQLPDRYRTFDVLAVPSVPTPSWDEQFCRVAVEAMASGVPVVASDTGALPEVVGDAGVLVPPGDAPALRDALSRVASSPGEWAELRRAGLERARAFAWDEVADRQLALYRAASR